MFIGDAIDPKVGVGCDRRNGGGRVNGDGSDAAGSPGAGSGFRSDGYGTVIDGAAASGWLLAIGGIADGGSGNGSGELKLESGVVEPASLREGDFISDAGGNAAVGGAGGGAL